MLSVCGLTGQYRRNLLEYSSNKFDISYKLDENETLNKKIIKKLINDAIDVFDMRDYPSKL